MANIRQRIEALEKQKRVRKIATTVVPPNVIQVTSDISALETRLDNEGVLGATASGTDTYTATITGVTAYSAGQIFKIKFTNANTGASTLNINSIGAIALKKSGTTALSSGDINAGQAFLCYYDGTNFQVIGIGGGGGSGTPGGSDTQVQRNNSGAFGGISDATSDGTSLFVTTQSAGDNTTKAASTAYADRHAFWRVMPTMTRVSGTQFTIPDTGNAGNWDKILSRLTVIRWTDTTTHLAMVSSSSYSSDVVTVNLVGDTLDNTFSTTSGKYAIEKAREITFAYAGTLGAITNMSRVKVSNGALKIFGARATHGTAGTTNATTYDVNYGSTPTTTSTIFTTKISVSSGSTDSGFYTANDNVTTQDGYYFNLDCDSVSTTAPIDVYVDLFYTFLNYQYLT